MTRSQLVRGALSLGLSGLVLVVLLPRLTGVGWGPMVSDLGVLTVWQVVVLLGLWLLGLWAHTFVATAALPDLTHRQALTLNLSGSAVSNLVPFGGALGMGLNYRMIRSWGHAGASFPPFTAITTLLNVLVKLTLPLVALIALLLWAPDLASHGLQVAGALSAVVLTVTVGAIVLALLSDRIAHWAATAVQRGAALVGRTHLAHGVWEARAQLIVLLRGRWRRMVGWSAVYAGLQALLLWLILDMLGSSLGVLPVFAGFAFGRVLTLLVVTPGGVGISETGMVGLLVALGGDPELVASGTLLFSAFTFALEIPVGGVCGLLWWRSSGRLGVAT